MEYGSAAKELMEWWVTMERETETQQAGNGANIPGSITRTIRAAIRLGEDYLTIEESITLPLDASEEDICHAVALGQRIYLAQRDMLESQVDAIRRSYVTSGMHTPETPASEGQRIYINRLVSALGWSPEQLDTYAREQLNIDDLRTLRKGQASVLIDTLKHILEERGASYLNHVRSSPSPTAPFGSSRGGSAADSAHHDALSESQYRALVRLAQNHGCCLDEETYQRFGVEAKQLTNKQAAELIRAWQSRSRESAPERPCTVSTGGTGEGGQDRGIA